MILRTVKIQLAVFALITLLTVSILSARFVGLTDAIEGGRFRVTAHFAASGGIFVGSEVTYRGVTVGKVTDLELTEDGVDVVATLDKGTEVPRATLAVVENRSAVGEQYLDLQPSVSTGPFLADGDGIARASTRTPLPVQDLLQHADTTVSSVPKDDLVTTVDELGTAFSDGGAADLQRLLDSATTFTASAQAALPQTVELIDDGRIVLDTQRATSGQVTVTVRNVADLAQTLQQHDGDLRMVLDRGVLASQQLNGLIKENQSSLSQLFANLITVGNVTTTRLGGITQLLVTYPDVVAGGYTVVPGDDTAHFGFVLNADDPPACTRGYEGTTKDPTYSTDPGTPTNTTAGCRLPRGSASDVRGAQNAPRPPSDQAGSSYPIALGTQPVPLGTTAVVGDQPLTVQTPLAPPGATGADAWTWMMEEAAR
ncbi:MCE family protein [Lapillicoccus jejuensis]|uniref:Phospholipid/cholesterol/gamma-HCH transport system substrate-binding protein n=1 Tax=Lapillicoccus jejuensis TaxID=402171 RepID=A0A542DWR4_9MICO|nr:MlaD family protein [Lapillicoccus jejuensis]TQJ07505.1 phospholipid/cholesterol/gamma-HCH transport system substrate-binding protein [Lapillicoccus jejuensis]